MVDDWHDGSLKVVELQKSHTFISNCEHFGDFGVENVDGACGRSLPNDTIIGEVAKLLNFCKQKNNCHVTTTNFSNVGM